MRKIISLGLILLFTVVQFAALASDKSSGQTQTSVTKTPKIEVYYFHYTRRCVTCNAVENVSRNTIAELYPTQFKKGLISFVSVNLDDKTSASLAKKHQAEGQALLITCGSKRTDLTDKAFMYARTSPAKLKTELKKVIDQLL